MQAQVNLHLIRAFTGPRHARLERIWERVGKLCPAVRIHVHNNLSVGGGPPPLPHGEMLQKIWEGEKADPAPFAIFTEFDFLPDLSGPGLLGPQEEGDFTRSSTGGDGVRQVRTGVQPVRAAEYVTRSPYGRALVRHQPPLAGAWWIEVDKRALGRDAERVDFRAGGPGNDPAGRLPPDLVELLPATQGTYSPFAVGVPGRGEHLFWSRHYNDPQNTVVAGFVMGEIQRAVDRACEAYEDHLDWIEYQTKAIERAGLR